MAVEERELSISPSAPVLGWRLFRVRRDALGPLVSAPMYRREEPDPDPPAWPAREAFATCTEGHPAPAPGCRCGIYAAIERTLDSLPGYLLDTADVRVPWGYAEVACSGRIFVDRRGIRAERAVLLRLVPAADSWPGAAEAAEDMQALRRRYAIPVVGIEEVPAWVTENRRSTGGAADGEMVDLDALDLPWPE